MAKLIQQPTNTSLLQPTKFQLTFARMPSVTYFCQTFNLPGLSMSEIVRSTPFVDLYVHGDKVQYEALDITFTVDEDLKTWLEMHNWITGLTFPKNFDQYRRLIKDNKDFGGTVSDAVMTVMSNKNTPNIRVTFKDCFPTSVSSINFDYTMDANMILTASASFRYNYFDVDIL
jgi:hypothetical protein